MLEGPNKGGTDCQWVPLVIRSESEPDPAAAMAKASGVISVQDDGTPPAKPLVMLSAPAHARRGGGHIVLRLSTMTLRVGPRSDGRVSRDRGIPTGGRSYSGNRQRRDRDVPDALVFGILGKSDCMTYVTSNS